MKIIEEIEEVLEECWSLEENNKLTVGDFLKSFQHSDPEKWLENTKNEKMINITGDKIEFSPEGREVARSITRRHRLSEVLFEEVFQLKRDQLEANACRFEHALSPEVTKNVCIFLGHPRHCPHGLPIPSGDCCKKPQKTAHSLITSLDDLEIGEKAEIRFLQPDSHDCTDKLANFGVIPGTVVRLHQKKPSFVIQIDETDLALDDDIARSIYVKRISRDK